MSNCFVRQVATISIINNVASFCAECYNEIIEEDTIFYNMQNCSYLCKVCQEALAESLDSNCERLSSESGSLFS